MKRIILILTVALCIIAPLIGQSQIRLLGSPDYQTTEAISDSLDAAEVAHDYMKRAAFPDSFNRAWNDSIIAAELRRNQAIKDSLALALLKSAYPDSADAWYARTLSIMRTAAFRDSFIVAWNDSIAAATLRHKQTVSDSLLLALLKSSANSPKWRRCLFGFSATFLPVKFCFQPWPRFSLTFCLYLLCFWK